MIKTFLINLERDKGRLTNMVGQLDALGIKFERVEAVYGTDMPHWLRPYFLDEHGAVLSKLLPGEVGCYASHLLVMNLVKDSGRPALVLEDDVEISHDLPEILNSIKQFPEGWEIVRLSSSFKRGAVRVSKVGSHYQLVKFTHVSRSTGAYIISPAGAAKFLGWKIERTLPVDQDLRRVWDCKLITYGVMPRPITPDVGISTIDGIARRHPRKRWKKFSLVDALVRIAFEIRWLGVKVWLLNLFYSKHTTSHRKAHSNRTIQPRN